MFCLTQAETARADLTPEQQAKQHTTVQPFFPFSSHQQNYLYVSSGTNKVSVGDSLSLKLSISTSDPTVRENIKHVTYLVRQQHHCTCHVRVEPWKTCAHLTALFLPGQVLNKGKIIAADRVSVAGQLLTSVRLTITPEMMPSFRFVAYYSIPWTGREEVVPDSIWVDVEDSCAGGVRSSKENVFNSVFVAWNYRCVSKSLSYSSSALQCFFLFCLIAESGASGRHSSRLHSREELSFSGAR